MSNLFVPSPKVPATLNTHKNWSLEDVLQGGFTVTLTEALKGKAGIADWSLMDFLWRLKSRFQQTSVYLSLFLLFILVGGKNHSEKW